MFQDVVSIVQPRALAPFHIGHLTLDHHLFWRRVRRDLEKVPNSAPKAV